MQDKLLKKVLEEKGYSEPGIGWGTEWGIRWLQKKEEVQLQATG